MKNSKHIDIQRRAYSRHCEQHGADFEACNNAACAMLRRYEQRNYRRLFVEGTPLYRHYEQESGNESPPAPHAS